MIGFFLVDVNAFSASDNQVALFRNVSGAATMVGGFLLGTASTKIKDSTLLTLGASFALSSLIWLAISPSFLLVLIAAILIGTAEVIINASSYAIVARLIPEEYRGQLFAYYNVTFFLSWGLGATLITDPISDLLIAQGTLEATAYRISFLVAALLVIIGLIILYFSFKQISKPSLDILVTNS